MKFRCVLCSIQCCEAEVLKRHYIAYHKVNEDDFCFKELFLPDNIEKNCVFCGQTFKSRRVKKNHMFLYHYGKQLGGGTKSINVLKRDKFEFTR